MNLLRHLIKQFIAKLITLGYRENDILNEMENYCNDPEEELNDKE